MERSPATLAESSVTLYSPLTGVVVPIEKVPDPVFAEKMVGEGVSVDPVSNVLLAPCDGEVTLIHPAKHAATIRHESGLEVLVHIGLDTVAMRGDGFEPLVEVGAMVKTGDEMIRFDLDQVATEAKSLLTQLVISNSDMLAGFVPAEGFVAAGKSVLATAQMGAVDEAKAASGKQVVSEAILVRNPTGLHARPAAVLASVCKRFDSDIVIRRGDDKGNAKSVVGIMGVEIGFGDKVQILATGSDSELAVREIVAAIESGLGEEIPDEIPEEPTNLAVVSTEAPLNSRTSDDPNVLLGVAASPGVGMGTVVQIRPHTITVKEDAPDKHVERRKLNQALDRAILQLKALEDQLRTEADPDKAAIFAAHQELLADPDLLDLASSAIDKGKSAGWAWREAFTSYASKLAGLKNVVLAGRATDVKDVGMRVLEEVTGQRAERQEIPNNAILIAEDLTPSDTASLDRNKVMGFATTLGGSSSHVAILARSLDIPAIAGVEARALEIPEGSSAIVDGSSGTLRINVSQEEMTSIKARQAALAAKRSAELAVANAPAVTTDGHRVEVVANIGSADDARDAMTKGAEGVGLLRTEFIFMARSTAPDEADQEAVYSEIAKALKPGMPLVIRTLDVGGDKPLSYLPIPREENPFLGERGIRVGIDRPDVLRTQVRALLKAAGAGAKLQIMFPMIATLEDFRLAKKVVDQEREALGLDPIPVGIMVEVPSVAMMAEQFAAEADFFSVGTNDLTQYTLAMDRGHPKLAPQIDGLNPAVLALIDRAVKAAHKHGKWVGVCGGLASDPQAVPILIGLGIDELSASIPAIPSVKAQVRELSLTGCQELAARALAADSAESVRAMVPVAEA